MRVSFFDVFILYFHNCHIKFQIMVVLFERMLKALFTRTDTDQF